MVCPQPGVDKGDEIARPGLHGAAEWAYAGLVRIPSQEPSVLVCHCKAVFEARVRAVIADGARDEFDVAAACGAGSGCGGCVPRISALLAEERVAQPAGADAEMCCAVAGALRREDARAR